MKLKLTIFILFLIFLSILGSMLRNLNAFNYFDMSTYSDLVYYNEFIDSFPAYSMIHEFAGRMFFGVVYLPHFYFVHILTTFMTYQQQIYFFECIITVLSILAMIRIEKMLFLSKIEQFICQFLIMYKQLIAVYYCNYESIVYAIIMIVMSKKILSKIDIFIIALFQFKIVSILLVALMLYLRNEFRYIVHVIVIVFILNFWYLFMIDFDFAYILYVYSNTFDHAFHQNIAFLSAFLRETCLCAILITEYRLLNKLVRSFF